jgi:hypothetical protein
MASHALARVESIPAFARLSGKPEFSPADYYGSAKPQAKTCLRQDQLMEFLEQWHPYGVRGAAYYLINRYLDLKGNKYPKDDGFFDKVGETLRIMRFSGRLSWDWIDDETRELERVAFWDGPEDFHESVTPQYRIDLWKGQPYAVLVLCEKRGLSGVLRAATRPRRVTFATLGGCYGLSLARDIIRWIAEHSDKLVVILYLGDYDPTGFQIHQWLWRDMYAMAPTVVPDYDLNHYVTSVSIKRLAVNSLGQSAQYGGISRPTKADEGKSKNTHFPAWLKMLADEGRPADEESVEVDSIPPEALQAMVSEAIEAAIDESLWGASLGRETRERARFGRALIPKR